VTGPLPAARQLWQVTWKNGWLLPSLPVTGEASGRRIETRSQLDLNLINREFNTLVELIDSGAVLAEKIFHLPPVTDEHRSISRLFLQNVARSAEILRVRT
jgi:hypothetical protein